MFLTFVVKEIHVDTAMTSHQFSFKMNTNIGKSTHKFCCVYIKNVEKTWIFPFNAQRQRMKRLQIAQLSVVVVVVIGISIILTVQFSPPFADHQLIEAGPMTDTHSKGRRISRSRFSHFSIINIATTRCFNKDWWMNWKRRILLCDIKSCNMWTGENRKVVSCCVEFWYSIEIS